MVDYPFFKVSIKLRKLFNKDGVGQIKILRKFGFLIPFVGRDESQEGAMRFFKKNLRIELEKLSREIIKIVKTEEKGEK